MIYLIVGVICFIVGGIVGYRLGFQRGQVYERFALVLLSLKNRAK